MSGVFVTGTDTGVGKTLIATALVQHLVASGKRVAGMKPISAGCVWTAEGWLNEDAAQLRAAANVALPLSLINPYAFAPPIAPHIAAQQTGITIELPPIKKAYEEMASQVDCVVVEGAGGLLVPLNETLSVADLIVYLGLPAILVVGMRLGCLNHTLLTVEAMTKRGIPLQGWVANQIDPDMHEFEANWMSLQTRISAPCLGVVPPISTHNKPMWIAWEKVFKVS